MRLIFIKLIYSIILICSICVLYPNNSLAKDVKTKNGVSITAISDESQRSNTVNSVYLLKPNEYEKYLDKKLDLDKVTPAGEAPLLLNNLSPGDYYIGVEINYDTDVIKPEMVSMNPYLVMPLPEKYYINDMYSGWGRGAHLSFSDDDGIANLNYYFVKWYRVTIVDKIEHVVALFLDKKGNLKTRGKFYPSDYKYEIKHTSKSIEKIWEQVSSIGLKTSKKEKEAILALLRKGGKVYFSRNGKPNVFTLDSKGTIHITGAVDIDEMLKMNEIFVSKNTLTSPTPLPSSRRTRSQDILSDKIKEVFPKYEKELSGPQEIRIYNPNNFTAYVAIRKEKHGKNLTVSPNSTGSVFVPNGNYDIFFVYSDKPTALFQGDSFSLSNNSIEIRLVKVVGGNYGIRRVK